jgi:hypothetical protein
LADEHEPTSENEVDLVTAAIGRIADAISAGELPRESDLALLSDKAFELSLDNGEFWIHALPKDSRVLERPQDRLDWSFLEDAIPEERLRQLNDGSEPTAEEIDLLREVLIKHLFEEPDDDITPGLWTLDLQGTTESAVAVIACEGYSFSGVHRWLLGVYRDLNEAHSMLSETYIFPSWAQMSPTG